MAWADTLLDCSFRGVVFDVVGTRDSFGRAVSVAEVPYVDGGDVTDLGGRPLRISLQAVFFGEEYEVDLYAALAAFNQAGHGELIHPVHGVIQRAQCVTCEVSHAAPEVDACTVTLEFVESGEPISFFEAAEAEQVQANVGRHGDSALDSMVNRLAEMIAAIKTSAPLKALSDLRQSMLGPLLGFTAQAQSISSSGLDLFDEPRAWAGDMSALANGVVAGGQFGNNLMADWRSITDVFSRLGADFGYGASGRTAGESSSPWAAGSTPSEAQGVAAVGAFLSVNSATAQADAAAIVLAAEFETPTLSPDEIETVVSAARTEIDAAIEHVRAVLVLEQSRAIVEPLKDQALALQQVAKLVIETRPPMVNLPSPATGNLRLIAHLLYGDHGRALELARLNNLRQPNALQKGDTLRAYAR